MEKNSYVKKLNNIIAVVSDVAMGDLSKRIVVEGEDEFAALGMAINEMIDTMNRYRTEMTEKLISVVSDVAMGDLSKEVDVTGEDEFAALGLAINEMITTMKRYRTEMAEKLITVVSDVAMGDLSRQVEVRGEDEFAALGMAINEMIDTMNRYRTEMTEKLISVVSDVAMGDLSQQVEVQGEDEFTALGMAINEMISGLREKEFIRDSFGKYVTKQVVEELLNGKLNLGGDRIDVTILLSDIRRFTSISEKEKPEDVVKLLNEYFTMMVNKILQHGGTIDKFIGDGILTIFGAPIRQKEHAQKAMDAAIAMQRELAVFNQKRVKEGLTPIKVGMAINSGEAIVGNIGSDLKMEYTVIGDTVNVAARVEKLNKKFKTDILITHGAYARATKHLEVRKLDPIILRGRKKSTLLYELKGITA